VYEGKRGEEERDIVVLSVFQSNRRGNVETFEMPRSEKDREIKRLVWQ
jgi:hypothetical protein